MPTTERTIVDRLVTAALNMGYTVSVYDDGAWPLKYSTRRAEVMATLGATTIETLRFRDSNRARVGDVVLVWGNGEDIISDYTDNAAMEALVAHAG